MNCFRLLITILICLQSPGMHAGTLSIDGPYLFHLPDGGARILSVDTNGMLIDTLLPSLPSELSMPVVAHNGKYLFDVKLHAIDRPAWKYEQPEKLLVMSDPHGKFEYFVSTLKANGVIDKQYNWSYGKNHLMIIGDVFDRGNDVLPIFWLIYKLEQEAQEAGGHVSFLLGNHEPMVLANDLRYVKEKYTAIAEHLNMNYADLFGTDTELGRWLATRNTIEVIGRDLFVHAGLGEAFLKQDLSIPQVNEAMSRALFMNKQQRKELSPLTEFLYGNEGPIWYRGMVRNDEKYFPLEVPVLNEILNHYQVNRIIVGHTIFPDVISFYNGKVIAVNVDNQKNFEKVLGRGILIKEENTYVIGDKEIMKKIK